MGTWRKATRQFYREQYRLLMLVLLFFVLGVVIGSLGAEKMPLESRNQLAAYLDGRWNDLSEQPIDRLALLEESLVRNLKLSFYIWFLGLTVIGVPIIAGLVVWRGFILGFTVGFLVGEMSWRGMLLTMLGILPHNLVFIPALIMAAVMGISFSIELVRGRMADRAGGLGRRLLVYSFSMLMAALVLVLAGVVEGVLSPSLIRLFNTWWS